MACEWVVGLSSDRRKEALVAIASNKYVIWDEHRSGPAPGSRALFLAWNCFRKLHYFVRLRICWERGSRTIECQRLEAAVGSGRR